MYGLNIPYHINPNKGVSALDHLPTLEQVYIAWLSSRSGMQKVEDKFQNCHQDEPIF